MYNMNRLAGLAFLPALWTSLVQGYAIDPADPTITAAPESNLLLQERQANTFTCSDWTIPGGFGYPICAAGASCYYQSTRTNGYAGCFFTAATTSDYYATVCWDYPTVWPGFSSPSADLYCVATAPVCGSIIYFDATGTWTQYGCASTRYLFTALATSLVGSTTFGGAAPTTTSFDSFTTPTSTSSSTPFFADPSPSPGSSSGSDSSSSKSNSAVIGGAVGGAVGGIAVIACAVFLFFFIRRRNRRAANAPGFGTGVGTAVEQPPPDYKSPRNFEPPAEYKAPATDAKPTTYVSEHC